MLFFTFTDLHLDNDPPPPLLPDWPDPTSLPQLPPGTAHHQHVDPEEFPTLSNAVSW